MKRLMLSAALVYAAYSVSAQSAYLYKTDRDYVNVLTGDYLEFRQSGVYVNDTLRSRNYENIDGVIHVYLPHDTALFFPDPWLAGVPDRDIKDVDRWCSCVWDLSKRRWIAVNKPYKVRK